MPITEHDGPLMTQVEPLRLGPLAGDHMSLRPTRRTQPSADDYWDGNWLKVDVQVKAGAFRCSLEADLRADDFSRLRGDLAALYTALRGTAVLKTLEGWVEVTIVGDGKGHLSASCAVMDAPGTGNRLTFKLNFDQTDVPPMLAALNAIVEAFPVKAAEERG